MIINKVIKAAEPYLDGRWVKDLVVGLSLIGVELDNGQIGIAYMSRENLPPGCSVFHFAQEIIGTNANEVALLTINGTDDAQRGVGMAVLSAASQGQNLVDVENPSTSFGIRVLPTDTVAMIGHIAPIANMLREKAERLIIFDSGISQKGQVVKDVYDMKDQAELLGKCDVAFITGTSITNGTIDGLLEMCSNARDIVIVGSSTPMFPEAFKDTNVTILAGSWWDSGFKGELFKIISLAGGIKHVRRAMIKKAVKV